MTNSIILLLFTIVELFEHYSTSQCNHGLIYNGEPFNSEDYPYIMFIRFTLGPRGYVRCTGSLISELFVLTAAKCTYGRNETEVDVTQGSIYDHSEFNKVAKIYLHKDFNPKENKGVVRGDISVLQLVFGFPYIHTFMKIGGSPADFAKVETLSCQMFGFGNTGNNKTKSGLAFMMTNDVKYGKTACQLHDSEMIKDTWQQYICLVPNGKSTVCLSADIGGPMVCNGKQYGIYSFGYAIKKNGGVKCGDPDQQEVYTFIYYHLKWLNNIIEKKKKKKRSFGNLLKPRYTLHIIVSILLYNIMMTFI